MTPILNGQRAITGETALRVSSVDNISINNVPEPSALLLTMVGMLALVSARLRRAV